MDGSRLMADIIPMAFINGSRDEHKKNKYAGENNGFKVKVEAMRWIQKHIRSLGGEPSQVTIGGYGAGSKSVILKLLPMAKDLGDLFTEVGDIQPALPPKQSRQTPTPTSAGSIAIPRPPSRRGEGGGRGRVSPSPIARADSVGSLEFRAAGVALGSSRGPSPLTIGMADTIPLAVAFHEIIHSYFRGTDETKCKVKLSGDMMVSFPAGIVTVLANNPCPAQLSFRIRNATKLENVLPNKQLVSLDSVQSTSESTAYDFNMSALTALLRRQSEQNPSASYFNVDILKYQNDSRTVTGAFWAHSTSENYEKNSYKCRL
ncbi:F-BAR domain only protein 2-like [Lycorma delicatula]|uniref:F-BAR domain only protein 2-like n=1 Tax=Lycorma delicatula TaxID=130591 RepID=UPI003F516C76